MLSREYFDFVDGGKRKQDEEDVPHIEDDEDRLCDEPGWTLEEMRPSVSDKVRLSVRLASNDVEMACASGGIEVPTDVRGVLSQTRQGVQETVDLRSSDSTQASVLSEKRDALRRVDAVAAERDDVLRLVEAV